MKKYPKKTIGELCNIIKGETGIASATPGEYPLVVTAKERKTSATYQFDTQAVCIPLVSSSGHGKKSLKYVHYQEGKFALGTILAAVIPKNHYEISAAFLHQYLFFYKETKIVPLMKGAANVSLAVKDIAKIEVPLPPINQQKDFIIFFNKLQKFNQELIREFDNQQKYIYQLKQAILQEAISGQLTAEWRKQNPIQKGNPDTDAAALLAKIKAEKQQLIADGKLKKEKPLPEILPDEIPFSLPDSWVWCRLGKCSLNRDDNRQPISRDERLNKEKIFPYYGASGIIDKIDGFTHEGINLLIGEDGANLISRSTPIAFVADGKYWVNNHAHVIGFTDISILHFIKHHINAIDLKPYVTGGFQPKLTQGNLSSIIIALPPLAEQKAIVEKVDYLMKIIDQLEAQIKHRKQLAEDLMQTVLREAFE
ncbi:restriction endonuclease subunit S [Microcoleus sp. B4-C1]|uniref:restriction endonuclease subunit S n=1 Tax=Microcoleus sp. B4-C1 TaxID=2818660 RepID=UPI002FD418A9